MFLFLDALIAVSYFAMIMMPLCFLGEWAQEVAFPRASPWATEQKSIFDIQATFKAATKSKNVLQHRKKDSRGGLPT